MSISEHEITCPNCGRSGLFKEPHEQQNDSDCLLFIFGGFIPWLLYSSSRSGRVQCMFCHYIFRRPAPVTSGVFLILWLVLIIATLYFLASL